jgi:hypothetical protein
LEDKGLIVGSRSGGSQLLGTTIIIKIRMIIVAVSIKRMRRLEELLDHKVVRGDSKKEK